MPVSYEWFQENFGNLCTLMGWSVSEKRQSFIYEELIDFEKSDIQESITRLKGEDRFIYANFWKFITEIRSRRLEYEAHERTMREQEELRIWFRAHSGAKNDCVNNYQCGDCKRIYCDVVSRYATQAIKDMIIGDVSVEDINIKLAGKFKGIGFEQNIQGLEPF